MADTQPLKLTNIGRRCTHLTPLPRMPDFAARIDGVGLTQLPTEPVKAELRPGLWDFEVVFCRPQTLPPGQHGALASVSGPPSTGSYFERTPGAPELEMIMADRKHPPSINN